MSPYQYRTNAALRAATEAGDPRPDTVPQPADHRLVDTVDLQPVDTVDRRPVGTEVRRPVGTVDHRVVGTVDHPVPRPLLSGPPPRPKPPRPPKAEPQPKPLNRPLSDWLTRLRGPPSRLKPS